MTAIKLKYAEKKIIFFLWKIGLSSGIPKNTRQTIMVCWDFFLKNRFAECNSKKHSANNNPLPSVFWKNTRQTTFFCRVSNLTLGKPFIECAIKNTRQIAVCRHCRCRVLFAECNTRQTAHGIYSVGKQLFAECFLLRTQQIVCRVSNLTLGKKIGLPSVFPKYTWQRIIVCRVFLGITLGKPIFQRKKIFFSQHTIIVCRVFLGITLGKPIFQRKKQIFSAYCYCLPSVFRITLDKPIFQRKNNNFCRVFSGITLSKPIFQRIFLLSIFQFNSCYTKHS